MTIENGVRVCVVKTNNNALASNATTNIDIGTRGSVLKSGLLTSGIPKPGDRVINRRYPSGMVNWKPGGGSYNFFYAPAGDNWNLYWNPYASVMSYWYPIAADVPFAYSGESGEVIIFDIHNRTAEGDPSIYRWTFPTTWYPWDRGVLYRDELFGWAWPKCDILGKYMNIQRKKIPVSKTQCVYQYSRMSLENWDYWQKTDFTVVPGGVDLSGVGYFVRISDHESACLGIRTTDYWWNYGEYGLPPGNENLYNAGVFYLKFDETTWEETIVRLEPWVDYTPEDGYILHDENYGYTGGYPDYRWNTCPGKYFDGKLYAFQADYRANPQFNVLYTCNASDGSNYTKTIIPQPYPYASYSVFDDFMINEYNWCKTSVYYHEDNWMNFHGTLPYFCINNIPHLLNIPYEKNEQSYTNYSYQWNINYTLYKDDVYVMVVWNNSGEQPITTALEIWRKTPGTDFYLYKRLTLDELKDRYDNLVNPYYELLVNGGIVIHDDIMYVIVTIGDSVTLIENSMVFYEIELE